MGLTREEKDWIKLKARDTAFEVTKEVLAEHIKSCPHGMAILKAKWLLIGVTLGPTIAGTGLGFVLAKLFGGA